MRKQSDKSFSPKVNHYPINTFLGSLWTLHAFGEKENRRLEKFPGLKQSKNT